MATVEIANEGYYFINDLKSLFNHDSAKKHPNLKIKQVITHPGEVTVIRTSPANRKILASKSDSNEVFLWTSDKYKVNVGTQYSNVPELILDTYRSNKPNYALRFAPSLPRVLTASGDRIELFDIENPQPTKRELGSMMNNNSIKPLLSLQGHDKVEDFAFKNN
jgi:WD40 repeat protein